MTPIADSDWQRDRDRGVRKAAEKLIRGGLQ